MDGEIGGLGGGRRADLVLLDDDLEVQNTWYGGELVVENSKITPVLDAALSNRYRYPAAAYRTVQVPKRPKLMPDLPDIRVRWPTSSARRCRASCCSTTRCSSSRRRTGTTLFDRHGLCFVTVIERHGKTNGEASPTACSRISA